MPLTPELANLFDGAVQRRGADYFRSGRVCIDSVSPTRIVATVRGSDRYEVELERQGRNVHASCTCPYADVDFCKHLWAVLMAVEGKSLLQGRGLELVLEDAFDVDDFEDEDEDEDEEGDTGGFEEDEISIHWAPSPSARTAKSPKEDWRKQIAKLQEDSPTQATTFEPWPSNRQLLYVIDVAKSTEDRGLYLEVLCRDRKKDGDWSKPKSRYLHGQWLQQMPDEDDRQILAMLSGATPVHNLGYAGYYGGVGYGSLPYRYRLRDPQPRMILPLICRTGRCHLRAQAQIGADSDVSGPPLTWRGGEPWQLRLAVHRSLQGKHYELTGALAQGEERMDVTAALIVEDAGVFFAPESAAVYEYGGASRWLALLREQGSLRVPLAQGEEFLGELLRQPHLPQLDLPEELRYEEVHRTPRPRLTVRPLKGYGNADRLQGELGFDYDGRIVAHGQRDRGLIEAAERRVLLRDFAAESAAEQRLHALGWRWGTPLYRNGNYERTLELAARNLPAVVRELTEEGWHVEAEGKLYRSPGQFDIHVSSGVDWFELHGEVKFGDTVAQLPELLSALRKGQNAIRLDDGSFGVLPQEWLKQFGVLAGLGQASGDHLRFRRSQVGLLDALLAAQPEARCDELFTRMREELRSFAGIHAQPAPAGFQGQLRPSRTPWDGFISCANSASADVLPTIWGWARPCRCWRSWRHDASGTSRSGIRHSNLERAYRWSSSRDHYSSIGSARRRVSLLACECSIIRAVSASKAGGTSQSTISC